MFLVAAYDIVFVQMFVQMFSFMYNQISSIGLYIPRNRLDMMVSQLFVVVSVVEDCELFLYLAINTDCMKMSLLLLDNSCLLEHSYTFPN